MFVVTIRIILRYSSTHITWHAKNPKKMRKHANTHDNQRSSFFLMYNQCLEKPTDLLVGSYIESSHNGSSKEQSRSRNKM